MISVSVGFEEKKSSRIKIGWYLRAHKAHTFDLCLKGQAHIQANGWRAALRRRTWGCWLMRSSA